MCSIAYQKEADLNMRFFEWWKNTSKNSDTECSQNEVKHIPKNSRVKNVKKGIKYLYAGFLAYCLLALGMGCIGGYYLSDPNADANVDMAASGGSTAYYSYSQTGTVSVTAVRSGTTVKVTVSGTLAYTPKFNGGFAAVLTDPSGKVIGRIQRDDAAVKNKTTYIDMSKLSGNFTYTGASPRVWLYAGPGVPGGIGETLGSEWRTGDSHNYGDTNRANWPIKHKSVFLSNISASVDVDSTVPSNNANGKINYVSQCQDIGWQSWVSDGATSGTTGKGLRMETIAIDSKLVGLSYQAHVAEKGWMSSKTNGHAAGTVGEGLAIQAIKISLTGDNAQYYTLKYRAHVANKGWMSWVNEGEVAGTTGQNLDMQAIEITLTPKSYTVTYNGNGATGGSMSNSDHACDTAKNLTTNGYTRNGYTFLGWSTSPNGSVQYSNGQSVKNLTATNGATVTLYAQWKQLGYEIDYDGNGADGGSTSTQYAPFNQTTTLNKNGYYKKGYKFKEWNSKANGSGESYKDQQSISVDGNKTVTKQ